MRRFTFASGSSHKFWSVGRDGATVTVHFGRVGTDGQTQLKELASDTEAEAHVTKLVAQKLKKGYTEDAEPSTGDAEPSISTALTSNIEESPAIIEVGPAKIEESTASAEATPIEVAGATSIEAIGTTPAEATGTTPTEATGTIPTEVAEAAPAKVAGATRAEVTEATPATATPAEVAGATGVAEATPVDEDTLVMPDAWAALVHPRRGGWFVPVLDVDPERAWRLVDRFRPKIVEIVTKDYGNTDLSKTRTYLDERVGAPHDAAAVAAIVEWALDKEKGASRAGESAAFVDAWIAEHGFAFAARAVMAQQRMEMNYSALYRRKRPMGVRHYSELLAPEPLVGRLRTHLAVASDEDYAAAVEALAECRQADYEKLVTAFLVPERTDWLDDALAINVQAPPLLVEALGDLDQLDFHPYYLCDVPTVVPTLVATFGAAVAPLFASMYDEHAGTFGEEVKHLLTALAILPTDEAFDLLLRRINKRSVRPALQVAMYRFPVRAARRLATMPANPTAAELLRSHVRAYSELLAKADLPDPVRAKLAQFPPPAEEADPATLPALLVTPPWTGKRTAAKPAVITGLTPNVAPSIAWLPGEREEWMATRGWGLDWHPDPKQHPNQVLAMLRNGQLGHYEGTLLATGPDELTRKALAEWRPAMSWYIEDWLPRIVARYQLDVLPGLLHLGRHGASAKVAGAFLPFADVEVAPLMADWLVRLKSVRQAARDWLRRHPETAARALVPAALGKPGKERRAAEAGLRVLDPATVTAIAAEYGEPAGTAIADMLATDPLDVLPARMPKLPTWLDVAALPQLVLRDGGAALPRTAVTHVVTMLAMSQLGDVYAGVDIVKDLCTPDSLAEFAWGLFGEWQSADMPAKDGWALTTLGWFGNDETVRRLTPLIRAWPGEGGHARAVGGLNILAEIGTDVALMHLHGIAQKVKFSGLRNKAKETIARVAADLELTPDQLADRLVPDLGLDDNGSMVLDYGPRRFVVGFDERLTPYVVDESGARRKDLPKPGVRDDQDKAPAAHKRFAALKKDVRTLAADQVRRLQQAMMDGRRWTAEEFTTLFVTHPLLRHVVRRLVWAHFEGDRAVLTFRVAEDSTFAGVTDDEVTLPADADVGIVHPLYLTDELAAWGEIFADYEILQPFPQLGRPVHALTDEERTATDLTAFTDITLPTVKVLGLTSRGWVRGEPQDNGVEWWIERPVSGGRAVIVNLDPGITVGAIDMFPEQKIEHVWLSADGQAHWKPRGTPFGELDPVTASEVLAELTELTGTTR